MQATDYQDRVRRIDAEIREHRKQEKLHRLAVMDARERRRALLEFCRAAGYELIHE